MDLVFFGSGAFGLPTLMSLARGHHIRAIVTQPDRPAGRGLELKQSDVKAVALTEGIPVLEPEKPRGPEFLATIRALAPEVSVVVAYGHILRR